MSARADLAARIAAIERSSSAGGRAGDEADRARDAPNGLDARTAPASGIVADHDDAADTDGAADTDDAEVQRAFAYLVRSTAQRPQTQAELRVKLARREVAEEVAEAALERTRAHGVVDDEAFARAWVADRGVQRGFGQARLQRELRRRMVPEPAIEDALGVLEERDDVTTTIRLARARLAQLPTRLEPEATARRLQAYLVRRGHSPALAQRAAIEVSGLDRHWD